MGLFDKLLGRTWQKFQARGDKYRDQDEPGLALNEYRAARNRFDGTESEAADLEERIADVRGQLRAQHIEAFEGYFSAGGWEHAAKALESARSQSTTDAQREEIDQLETRLASARVADGETELPGALPDEAHAPGQTELVNRLAAMPDRQADAYEALGQPFRDGWLALENGNIEDAVPALEEALESAPDSPWVHAELGRAYVAADRNEEGIERLVEASELAPRSIYVKLAFARALWSVEDFERAEQVLQAAHDIDEEDESVLVAVAQHALLSGDYQSGIDAMEVLLESTSRPHWSLVRVLGQLHEAAGHVDEAIECYEGVLDVRWKIDPDTGEIDFDPVSALSVARLYVAHERKPDRAIDLLHAMLSITSGSSAASMWLGIARAHRLKSREDEARDALEKATALLDEDDDPELRAQLEEALAS